MYHYHMDRINASPTLSEKVREIPSEFAGARKTNQEIEALGSRIQAQIGSIAAVASSIESITEMSHSISKLRTEEQTTNARQVATAMENVNDLTQQAAAAAGHMFYGTIELSNLAQQLKTLVEQFAVGEGMGPWRPHPSGSGPRPARPALAIPTADPVASQDPRILV